ncbi:uncharacterized protein LOC107039621 isoform X2 [Diachasma alloeum]|nr:uncharacterized protein LOC107039621 isoform X2 [Diachasma alloeum]
MSDQGCPVTKDQLLNSVQKLVESLGKVDVFTDGRPGRHWYGAFQKRHPEVEDRLSENTTSSQAKVTEEKIRHWFEQVKNYLVTKNLLGIDSSRVFNCEESGFYLCPKGQKVLIKRGNRAAFDEKECLTALFCGNAAGHHLPPMITFNYIRIPAIVTALTPKDYTIGRSTTGWMTPTSFLDWIRKSFHPWIVKNEIEMPVVLYLNGHSAHLTLQLSDFCRENGIELISIHPNYINFLQPMDVAVFHPLKAAWRDAVTEWRLTKDGNRVKREHFGGVLEKALGKMKWESILANGFQATGLHPFNPDAIHYEENVRITRQPQLKTSPVPTEPELPCYSDEQMTYIEFVEANIDSQLLQDFKLVGDREEWSGDVAQSGLFLFWRKIKNCEGSHGKPKASASAEDEQNPDSQKSFLANTSLRFHCPSFNTFLNEHS